MWVPLLLIGIVAFVIAHCFLTVYEVRIGEIMLFFQFEMTHNTLDTTVNDPIKMEDSDPSFSRHKAVGILIIASYWARKAGFRSLLII